MKLSDLKKQIVIVCGKICSGKGHFCANQFPGYYQVTVSDVVKQLAKTQVRSELSDTKSLDMAIADVLIEEINKHDKVVVDGIRQRSIIERLVQAFGSQIQDIIWLDVPEETLRQRFEQRGASKDDLKFDVALQRDNELGLSDVEQYIKQHGKSISWA
jgi:dephospho-CoA kinase